MFLYYYSIKSKLLRTFPEHFVAYVVIEISYMTILWATAIAPWFCLLLLQCGPGLESQSHHLGMLVSICIIEIVNEVGMRKGQKCTKKGPELAHIFTLVVTIF